MIWWSILIHSTCFSDQRLSKGLVTRDCTAFAVIRSCKKCCLSRTLGLVQLSHCCNSTGHLRKQNQVKSLWNITQISVKYQFKKPVKLDGTWSFPRVDILVLHQSPRFGGLDLLAPCQGCETWSRGLGLAVSSSCATSVATSVGNICWQLRNLNILS